MRRFMEDQAATLGHAIAMRRAQLGMTQAELADAIGLATSSLSLIERGGTRSMRPRTEQALCDVLGWSSLDDAGSRPSSMLEATPADLAAADMLAATERRIGRPLTTDERAMIVRAVDGMVGHNPTVRNGA